MNLKTSLVCLWISASLSLFGPPRLFCSTSLTRSPSSTHQQRQVNRNRAEVIVHSSLPFFLSRKNHLHSFTPSPSYCWISHGRKTEVPKRPCAFGCLQRHRDNNCPCSSCALLSHLCTINLRPGQPFVIV
jgi:hypothetical protein